MKGLILLVALFGGAGTQESEATLQQGILLIQQKDFAGAMEVFSSLKAQNPEAAAPYFYSGLALDSLGKSKEALSEIEFAVERDPKRAEYVLALMDVASKSGVPSLALRYVDFFKQSEAVRQLDPVELGLLSDVLLRLDHWELALEVLQEYSRLRPEDPSPDFRRGQIFLTRGQFEAGEEAFRSYLERKPDSAAGHYGLGRVLDAKGQMSEAREEFAIALQIDPTSVDYRYHLATTLVTLKESERALEVLYPIRSDWNRYPRMLNTVGRAYRQLGDLEKARHYFELFRTREAERDADEDRQKQVHRALAAADRHLQNRAFSPARVELEQILDVEPDHWLAGLYLARLDLASGRARSAVERLLEMEQRRPDDFEVNFLLAGHFLSQGKVAQARPRGERAKEARPDSAEARNLLGNIYFSLGMKEQAALEYEAAMKLDPARPEYRLNYEAATRP